MRLLDLCCGAGGALEGYYRAGFHDYLGVDILMQPRYPRRAGGGFVQADAVTFLEFLLHEGGIKAFDAIHASPPCQRWTQAAKIRKQEHPDLITPLRPLLEASGLPYVMENVQGAPLINPVLLDGTMFPELHTKRPRLFEANWHIESPFFRFKVPQVKMGRDPKDHEWIQVIGNFTNVDEGRRAMGIDWMTRDELREAIPPAYTEFIGKQLVEQMERVA